MTVNRSNVLVVLVLWIFSFPAQSTPDNDKNSVRLMTLNIAHARADGRNQMMQTNQHARTNLENIANVIDREQPDIVAFQEIDSNSFWNGRFNHGRFIAEKANYDHWFTGSHQLSKNLDYGTGLMSKFKLSGSQSLAFNRPFARMRKGLVLSTIEWPTSAGVMVDLVSLHLDFLSSRQRHKEIGALIEMVTGRNNLLIVMGDFNMDFDEPGLQKLLTRLDLQTWLPGEEVVTFPRSGKRLDWIMVSRQFSLVHHQVLSDSLSDHQAVIMDITLPIGHDS
jgi:endonuclease/exonuclease/phosphatase family metal-dependent hydrolase